MIPSYTLFNVLHLQFFKYFVYFIIFIVLLFTFSGVKYIVVKKNMFVVKQQSSESHFCVNTPSWCLSNCITIFQVIADLLSSYRLL